MPKKSKNNLFTKFNEARSDYHSSKSSRYVPDLKGVNPAGSGHSYHIRSERGFLKIIERARDLTRNDPIIGSGLKRVVANVVQEGFNLDPQTGDKALDEDLKERFRDWADDPNLCHSEGELTFSKIEQLTLMSVLRDGDMLHLPLKNGSLQCIEAHRLRTPNNTKRDVVHGVLLDKRARRTEYWVTKEELGLWESLNRVQDVQQYPARDVNGHKSVLHIYLPDRFSQRRGIS